MSVTSFNLCSLIANAAGVGVDDNTHDSVYINTPIPYTRQRSFVAAGSPRFWSSFTATGLINRSIDRSRPLPHRRFAIVFYLLLIIEYNTCDKVPPEFAERGDECFAQLPNNEANCPLLSSPPPRVRPQFTLCWKNNWPNRRKVRARAESSLSAILRIPNAPSSIIHVLFSLLSPRCAPTLQAASTERDTVFPDSNMRERLKNKRASIAYRSSMMSWRMQYRPSRFPFALHGVAVDS